MRIILSIVVIIANLSTIVAQPTKVLPVQFTHFFKTYSFLNPASIGMNAPFEAMAGDKALTGAFAGVQTIYANINLQLSKDSVRKVKHVMGITFVNDKEGSFINRSRVSLLYALHIPLSEKFTLSSGTAVGFVNHFFGASNINPGGSDLAPNIDFGIWLRSKSFNLGISGDQLVPFTMRPIDQAYVLSRHYNIVLDKSISLSRHLKFTPTVLWRWDELNNKNFDFALLSLIHENLLVAVSYKYERALAFSAGLERIKIGNQIFRLMLSYNSPAGKKLYYNPQSYDLLLSYVILKKKKYNLVEESVSE